MPTLSRRQALQSMGMSALAVSLAQLGSVDASDVLATSDLANWQQQFCKNGADLAERNISPLRWQEVMDRIYRATPLEALKQEINLAHLSKTILDKMPSDRGEYFEDIAFGQLGEVVPPSGKEPPQKLIVKIAHVRKGKSVPPHGHSNMVSAFLCLSGEFDVRLYDRLDDRKENLVVRQTVHQKTAGPGTWSSISDYRDNVHWLTARSDDCFLFTVKMLNLEEGLPLRGRINIDLVRAQKLGSSTYLAPVISHAQAQALYY